MLNNQFLFVILIDFMHELPFYCKLRLQYQYSCCLDAISYTFWELIIGLSTLHFTHSLQIWRKTNLKKITMHQLSNLPKLWVPAFLVSSIIFNKVLDSKINLSYMLLAFLFLFDLYGTAFKNVNEINTISKTFTCRALILQTCIFY